LQDYFPAADVMREPCWPTDGSWCGFSGQGSLRLWSCRPGHNLGRTVGSRARAIPADGSSPTRQQPEQMSR
jgi:hypothetical protein